MKHLQCLRWKIVQLRNGGYIHSVDISIQDQEAEARKTCFKSNEQEQGRVNLMAI